MYSRGDKRSNQRRQSGKKVCGKKALGYVIKYYFVGAYYGIVGADKLAKGTPAAILGIDDGYFIVGHNNGSTFTNTYAETTTVTFFLIQFGHLYQYTISI